MANAEPIPVRPLRVVDIPRVVQICEVALEDDPLLNYVRNTSDAHEGQYSTGWRLVNAAGFADRSDRGHAWTVGDGDAVVASVTPDDVRDDIDKLIDYLMPFVPKLALEIISPEQRKRQSESMTKNDQVAREVLGERLKDMIYLESLATYPPMQGRGYGSALIKQVTDEADAQGRATWLFSSNIANTGFYQSNGFFTVAQVIIGNDNPSWHGPPIIVPLMVREVPTSPP